jgi:hypothetical protein
MIGPTIHFQTSPNTARLMTSEELAAAGLSPNKREIHDSRNCEDGKNQI